MARSPNAQLAVDQYKILQSQYGWRKDEAWFGIALQLLSCNIYLAGWRPFHECVVYRESNDFKLSANGMPNATIRRAKELTNYLAARFQVTPTELCDKIGLYWKDPVIGSLQPHNLVGHAFRSICLTVLEMYGDPGISYEEEVKPTDEFPGYQFNTRSPDAKIDIVARRGNHTVALISVRWRYRHDRVDVVEEAIAYASAARRHNAQQYALIGEFAPNRLLKILENAPPVMRNAALSAAVHFAPELITNGLGENGRLSALRSLAWLIDETHRW